MQHPVRRPVLHLFAAFLLSTAVTTAHAGTIGGPPTCTGDTGLISVPAGVPYMTTFTGIDPDGGMLLFDSFDFPPGAVFTPPIGSMAFSPLSIDMTWTPAIGDVGMVFLTIVSFFDEAFLEGGCFVEYEVTAPATTTTTTTTTTTSTTTTTTTTTSTTTTTLPCGNGVLDPGEQCDPPSGEICNNLIDDDADMLIDCDDPDCTPLTLPTCDAACQEVPPCQPIEDDPAIIRFSSNAEKPDYFKIHGRFRLGSGEMYPDVENFGILLTNANGVVYRGELEPGLLVKKSGGKGRFKFRDRFAKKGLGTSDGLSRVGIRPRAFSGVDYIVFSLRAYGDLSAATLADMTTQVVVGNDVGSLSATWKQRPNGWRLSVGDFK